MYALELHPNHSVVSLDELMATGYEPSQEQHDDAWEELRGLATAGALPEPGPATLAHVPSEAEVDDLLELALQLEPEGVPYRAQTQP